MSARHYEIDAFWDPADTHDTTPWAWEVRFSKRGELVAKDRARSRRSALRAGKRAAKKHWRDREKTAWKNITWTPPEERREERVW